jgi:putative addiction module antidote
MNAPARPEEINSSDTNAVQLRRIGNSVGFILPKDLLGRLRLKEGDSLQVIEQPDGSFNLRMNQDAHARAMAIAHQLMIEYADTMRELAR